MSNSQSQTSHGTSKGAARMGNSFVGRAKDKGKFLAEEKRKAEQMAQSTCFTARDAAAEKVASQCSGRTPPQVIAQTAAAAVGVARRACKNKRCGRNHGNDPATRDSFVKDVIFAATQLIRSAEHTENRRLSAAVRAGQIRLVRVKAGASAPDGAMTYRKYKDGPAHVLVTDDEVGDWGDVVALSECEDASWVVACTDPDVDRLPKPAAFLISFLRLFSGGRVLKTTKSDVYSKRYWNVKLPGGAVAVLKALYGSTGGKVIKPTPEPRMPAKMKAALKQLTGPASANMFESLEVSFSDEEGDDFEDDDVDAAAGPAEEPVDGPVVPVVDVAPVGGNGYACAAAASPGAAAAEDEDDWETIVHSEADGFAGAAGPAVDDDW
jgi:hypothetical protein